VTIDAAPTAPLRFSDPAWVNIFVTVAYVLIASATLWAIARQAKAAHATLEVMRQQAALMEAQTNVIMEANRPHLSVDPSGDPFKDIQTVGVPAHIQIEITNKGLGRATDARYETWVELLAHPFDDLTSQAKHDGPRPLSNIVPNDHLVINLPIGSITPAQLPSIRNASLLVCFRLRIHYADMFKQPGCAEFCCLVDPQGFRPLPKYNGDCQG
jgi:hypothetical protein